MEQKGYSLAVYKLFRTTSQGLSNSEVQARLKEQGYNELKTADRFHLWKLFVHQCKDILLLLLIIAAVIAWLSGAVSDALLIMIIVFINICIGFIQEFKAEKSIEALKKMVASTCNVIRDGKIQTVSVRELVVGDIIVLEEGTKIPADAVIMEAVNVTVNEASLTGESAPISKKAYNFIEKKGEPEQHTIFTGTILQTGHLTAVVIATGMKTKLGKIAKLTTQISLEESPLQDELNKVGKFIGKVALTIALFVIGHGLLQYGFSLSVLQDVFLFSIALAVAVVPEGLPATVTIALAMGVKKMAAQNAVIRQLSSVETLGCTTVICTDKTGTLTKNEMTVEEIFIPGKKSQSSKEILTIACLCNNAQFSENTMVGDPTELALLDAGVKGNINVNQQKLKYPRIYEIPFTSERKMMMTIHKLQKKYVAYAKGAPYEIITRCSHIRIDGKIKKFTMHDKEKMLKVNRSMGDKALRVLACSYKSIPNYRNNQRDKHHAEKNMIFVGFIGMIDPPRPEVKEAIQLCKSAGISIIMMTGDQRTTAHAIAQEIGIATKEDAVLTGAEIEAMNDNKLSEALKTVHIFARINPEQKLRIVTLLQKQGHVVAMTGDGVNDAPALKKADIGVAMGRIGTDVSKEAAKMVLLDDSFSTIVQAVKEGRAIYNNIIKFILYVFSGITAEFFVVMFSLLPGVGNLLSAVQILWIDLGTEVLPALALSVDPVSEDIMKQKPRDRNKPILNKETILRILGNSIVIALCVIGLYYWFLHQGSPEKAATIPFVTIIIYQMINIFNCRGEKTIFNKQLLSNKYLLGGILVSIISTVIVISVPQIATYFHAVPLSIVDWGIIFVSGLSMVVLNEAVKWLRKKYYNA